jgi:WD40 repeat protein
MSAEQDIPAPVTGAAFVGGVGMGATGEGLVMTETGQAFKVHDGAILCAVASPDGSAFVTGGDDGKLVATTPAGESRLIADFKGKWVNHLVAGAESGALVAAVGNQALVWTDLSAPPATRFAHPSTVSGLALDAKGRRLAVSHYGGATLRYVLAKDDPGSVLKWAGSHIGVAIAPDASYVVTAMQEFGLHGWRVADKKDLRMAGYEMKTRSMSFEHKGRALATSGADCAVVWPFIGKDGPMGKPPALLAQRQAASTAVAFHPQANDLAIGYSDGAVVIANLEGPPATTWATPSGWPISCLLWSEDGTRLAAGDEGGNLAVGPA